MWAISDEDTTIFLFGTFHALDRDTGWFSNIVRAAFDHSEELVLETIVPSDPAELFASLSRQSLTGEAKAGQPVIATSRPNSGFVETSTQAMSAGRSVGMSVDHGADSVLRREAESEGKRIGGLESFDFQLAMFSSLPSPPQTADAGGNGSDMAAAMQTMKMAWKRGDSSQIAAVLGTMEQQSPETYRRLFAERNTRWAEWVARRMERPGVVFVAVGSGHLIGRDSVQQRLTERGYQPVRVS
ncbi:TraB/GumN family protein [Sphingomonas sp. HDW15A]|uniref:TraB/GumN family protein n=1 Tax=Sphingomonas sp. HDW15A TaxID=2714942 RepID=UPI00140BD441|nr:TraB/GumN family protein [Sphingomonas sp. HDW15A]QIK96246.1 TraB/GumN family protein [Sphingomonas sp. HDW15A]